MTPPAASPKSEIWRQALEACDGLHEAFVWATTVEDESFDTIAEVAASHPKVTVRRRAAMALLPVMARRAERGDLWPPAVDSFIDIPSAARVVSLNRAPQEALLAILTALPPERGGALLSPIWDALKRGGHQSKDLGVALLAFRLSPRVPDLQPAFAWLANLISRQDLPEHDELVYVARAFEEIDDLPAWLAPILTDLRAQGINIFDSRPPEATEPQLRPLFVRWACGGYEHSGDRGAYNDWCDTLQPPPRAAPKKKGKRKKGSGFRR